MPDESSPSSEHAILQEITAPLSTLPDDPVPIAADVDFPVVLRGYDRLAVDAYVKKTSQRLTEIEANRSPNVAVRRALEQLGEQISGILKRAHDTAAEIEAQSRREADERLERSRREAEQMTAQAQIRLKDLDSETDRIWGERHRIVDDVRDLSRQLLELADSAATRFPPAEEPAAARREPEFEGDELEFGQSGAEVPGAVDELEFEDPDDPADDETREFGAIEDFPAGTSHLRPSAGREPLDPDPFPRDPLAGDPRPEGDRLPGEGDDPRRP